MSLSPRILLIVALVAVSCTGGAQPAQEHVGPGADLPCIDLRANANRAKNMLAGKYKIGTKDPVPLPEDLTWSEDPFGDINWQARLVNLTWTEHLIAGWLETGDERYFTRYEQVLRDFMQDNAEPPYPSKFSWNRHVAAQRAFVYACATRFLDAPWLDAAIAEHGRRLARPRFYIGHGNHALNQNIDLFMLGCASDRTEWMDLARERLVGLAAESIDREGVNNEQSIYYQYYNWRRYGVAKRVFNACGDRAPKIVRERQPKMLDLLTYATLPNGRLMRLGDTTDKTAPYAPGTTWEFAATQGGGGVKPTGLSRVFEAGYALGRSGWGERRAFEDETMYGLRFGAAPQTGHAHWEGTSLFLYGYGGYLLDESGLGHYGKDEWRDFFKSPQAQNRVVIDGARFDPTAPTDLVASRRSRSFDAYVMRTDAWRGVDTTRRVLYSRRGGYLVVQDTLRSERNIDAQQLWHLAPDAAPALGEGTARTARARGNVTLRWLDGDPRLDTVKGQEDPIQGWVSYSYDEWEPRPVLRASDRGRTITYLTLIVPWAEREPDISARVIRATPDGFTLRVKVGSRFERVEVRGNAFDVRVA